MARSFISRGDYNTEIAALHQKLSELGYYWHRAESPWSAASERALMILQENLDQESTGVIDSKEQLDEYLAIDHVVGKNMVMNGDFSNGKEHWSAWGSPVFCEIEEIDGKSWMHLISSGTHWEGLYQSVKDREKDGSVIEFRQGEKYTVSFIAYGASESVENKFNIGFHNRNIIDNNIQEQYWTPVYNLSSEPTFYKYTFTCKKDGTCLIMVGTGQEEIIEAYFTDVKVEAGTKATEYQ